MKIVSIFAAGLFAVHWEGETSNELARLLDLWNDPLALTAFIIENENDVSGFSHEELVDRLLDDAEAIDELLARIANEQGLSLDQFFRPLDNWSVGTLSLSKHKGRKNYFRLYAIRVDTNCYVLTGGGIKFGKVHRMQDREHLAIELIKLEKCSNYLKEQGVIDQASFYELLEEEEEL